MRYVIWYAIIVGFGLHRIQNKYDDEPYTYSSAKLVSDVSIAMSHIKCANRTPGCSLELAHAVMNAGPEKISKIADLFENVGVLGGLKKNNGNGIQGSLD